MPERECIHCHQRIENNQDHDCWTVSEETLTADLSEDLQDAWERIRETALNFGKQRIYASHKSIMFSRQACYFFVRPKKNYTHRRISNYSNGQRGERIVLWQNGGLDYGSEPNRWKGKD